MNQFVRRWTAFWAALVALIASMAIVPDAIPDTISAGKLEATLGWSSLVAVFTAAAFVVEALQIGRSTRHRAEINTKIATGVLERACKNPGCPQVSQPSAGTRSATLSLFYTLIDAPSREVAFHNWGWYYWAVNAAWFAGAAALLVIATWPAVSTDLPGVRALGIVILLALLAVALRVRRVWETKTMRITGGQLQQIAGRLPGALQGAECTNPACPCR